MLIAVYNDKKLKRKSKNWKRNKLKNAITKILSGNIPLARGCPIKKFPRQDISKCCPILAKLGQNNQVISSL